jgi:UDPglucose 6-dehydrogenase
MRIAVIGMGYVGLTTAATLAHIGHDMYCVEIDEAKLDHLRRGECPIYEEYLEGLMRHNHEAGRLHYTADIRWALGEAEVVFIAVGTPLLGQWGADLSQIRTAMKDIASFLKGNSGKYLLIVMKSTVPTRTCDAMISIIREIAPDANFDLVSNPEFLREGNGVFDTLYPDRIVIGSHSEAAADKVVKVFAPIIEGDIPDAEMCPPKPGNITHPITVVRTDPRSSELIKYAANAFLATKISFINEIANLAEKTGADIEDIALGIGLDKRIGPHFLRAGIGYGGSCFPKDTAALAYQAESFEYTFKLLNAVIEVNQRQRIRFLYKIMERFGYLDGRCIGFLGLSFKPGTDDVRDSPGIELMRYADVAGAEVRAYDPVAILNAKKVFDLPDVKLYFADPYEMAEGCDCIAIVTDWPEFKELDWSRIKELLKEPIIFDGRNMFKPDEMKRRGFEYHCVGRVTQPI